MRIVFLSHYFPPEVNAPASRTFETCRAWVRAGHQVTVVTCAPNHPAGKVYAGYRNRPYARERVAGIEVIRLMSFVAANRGVGLRTLNYLSFLLAVAIAAPWLPRGAVVVSTSPQFFCGLAGWAVRRLQGGAHGPLWVLEVRDLWPESIVTVGALRKNRLVRALEGLETAAYRSADSVVAVTDSFVPHIVARRGEARGVTVVKNGVDLSLFTRGSPQAAAELRREHGLEGRFVAAYVGTHGMAHALDTVLRAAERLKSDPAIAFLLVGDGAERERLLAMKARLGLHNVVMLGQQPKSAMPAVWQASDASLIVLRDDPAFEKVLPSKMFEAMAMGLPLLLGVRGEALALLEAADAGLAFRPEDDAALAAAVRQLAADPVRSRRLGESGRAHVHAHFDRERLAAAYVGWLEQLVRDRGAGRCGA